MHKLEVQAIADGEVAAGIIGLDPVLNGQLAPDEVKRCEQPIRARVYLKMIKSDLPQPVARSKGPRYTPVSKRADKPDAIAYLVKTHPELLDAQIARLLGTTQAKTIASVRDRTHWNATNIKPRNPVLAGLSLQAVRPRCRPQARPASHCPRAEESRWRRCPQPDIDEPMTEPASAGAGAHRQSGRSGTAEIDPDAMIRGMG